MADPTPQELEELRAEAKAWLEENNPGDPGFLLPQSFMEVGTDDQFHYLRDWQNKVYDAGYLGMSWPKEYGGGGLAQAMQSYLWKNVVSRYDRVLERLAAC